MHIYYGFPMDILNYIYIQFAATQFRGNYSSNSRTQFKKQYKSSSSLHQTNTRTVFIVWSMEMKKRGHRFFKFRNTPLSHHCSLWKFVPLIKIILLFIHHLHLQQLSCIISRRKWFRIANTNLPARLWQPLGSCWELFTQGSSGSCLVSSHMKIMKENRGSSVSLVNISLCYSLIFQEIQVRVCVEIARTSVGSEGIITSNI